MAGLTRLELAASCVTGRRSNQLNYNPVSENIDRLDIALKPFGQVIRFSVSPKKWAILDSNQ